MASQNAARLGIVLAVDSAELKTKISEAEAAFDGLAKSAQSATKRAAKDLQDLIYQTADYGKTLTKVELIERQIAAGRYKNADKSMIDALRLQAKAYDDVAKAQKNVTDGMTQQQKMALTYQTTDLFTQIASGQNPMIALIQQGGQLKDSMGGLGNMFRVLGTLVTPVNVAMVGLAATFGTIGYAIYKAIDDLDKFKDAMTLTGGIAGVTYDKLLNIGNTISEKTNETIGNARDVMQTIAASGKFTASTMQNVGEVILRFSRIAGVNAADAAKTLIPLLDGTASSAKQLNDKYHFLTIEQYKNIEALERQGKLQESIKLQAQALNDSFESTQRQLGALEKAWQGVANFASAAWNAMMGWGREDGSKRALELEKMINELTQEVDRRKEKGLKTGSQESAIKAFRNELEGIVAKETEALKKAEARAKVAEKNKADIAAREKAGGLAKQIQLENEYNKLVAHNAIDRAKQTADAVLTIQLDADKRKADVLRDEAQKNEAERGVFAAQNKKIADQQIIAIEIDTQNKLRDVRRKYAIAEMEDGRRQHEEMANFKSLIDKERQAKLDAGAQQVKELENAKEMIELQNRLVYMTEKEQKLAEVSLKYEQRRREIVGQADEEFLKAQLDKQQAIENFNIELQDKTLKSQQVFNSLYSAMGNAIDNFVKGGKSKFSDFARSVIRDMIAMQMKAQALQIMRYAFNFFAMPAMGPSPSGGGALDASFNQYLAPRANGGPVYDGTPYMVGERGPELFVPNGSGTIIPNNALSNVGGPSVVYNGLYIANMSAIDTQSAIQFLSKNKQAVWAANQSAQRSMPVSR